MKGEAVQTLLADVRVTQSRIEGMVKLAFPDVHRAFKASMDELRRRPKTATHARSWASSFQAMSLIHNRRTPWHRDAKGCLQGVDALLTVGNYSGGLLIMTILGLTLTYEPGTLVLIPGAIIPHEVPEWSKDGDRICLVHFTHKHLLDELSIPHPTLPHLSDISPDLLALLPGAFKLP